MGRWVNPDFPAGASGYIYQMRCTQGNVYLWLALDADGKIATDLLQEPPRRRDGDPGALGESKPARKSAIIPGYQ